MNFYLDFDYTLFDTYLFRENLYKILLDNGLEKNCLELTLENESDSHELLDVKKVFENLSKENDIPLSNFLTPLEKLYERCYEFLYDDTIGFLKYLKKNNHKIYILTWGNEQFQKQKIEASKLTVYVDGVIVTEQLKYKLDIDYKNGIFIDDSIRDLEGLYKKGAAGVFRIIRKNGKNSNKKLNNTAIKEFISLEEIKDYLETETNKS